MFNCYICAAPKGCQARDHDDREWSMGAFNSATFNVDNNGVSLQFSNGDDNRYSLYRSIP